MQGLFLLWEGPELPSAAVALAGDSEAFDPGVKRLGKDPGPLIGFWFGNE